MARVARAHNGDCLLDNGGVSEIITPRTHRLRLSRSGLSPCPDIITVWLLSLVCGALVPLGTAVLCGARHGKCVEPWSKTD